MPLGKPKPQRYNEDEERALKEMSEALECDEVWLVRKAVKALWQHFSHHKRRLLLPLNFDETFVVIPREEKTAPMVLLKSPADQSRSGREAGPRRRSKVAH